MRALPAGILCTVALVAGCATAPPGTPGAGVGATYTPVIDMQGIADHRRYHSDLAQCRQYAFKIDAQAAGLNEAVGQAIFSGAIMAALGGRGRSIDQSASAGMLQGLNRGTGRALNTQERIITNCMAGRGYRTLDAAYVNPGAGSPYSAPIPSQAFAPTAPTQAEAPPATPVAPAAVVVAGAALPVVAVDRATLAAAAPVPHGGDSWTVERLSEVKACNATPKAVLNAKGPGFESYTVGCKNGDALLVRCEYGQCRVMR